jgi:hypothetical protein
MLPTTFDKFNKYEFFPDLSNKFLFTSTSSIISPKSYDIYLKYTFNDRLIYNAYALKALLMLTSIYPTRCHATSRMILVKFAKNRCISSIFIKFSLQELAPLFSFIMKRPTNLNVAINGSLNESKYFTFPGFVKLLKFPSWEHKVSLSLKQPSINNLYFLLFYKTAYLD